MATQYSIQELREIIAETIFNADNAKLYLLSDDVKEEVSTPDHWFTSMKKDGTWCDEIFIHLAANFLKKKLFCYLSMLEMVMVHLVNSSYHH